MNLTLIASRLNDVGIPRVAWYPVIDSTKESAARLASIPEWEEILVLADQQTAGKGTHGRKWFSTPGQCLLVSLLVHPREGVAPETLSRVLAESVSEGIRSATGLECTFKAPNDLLLDGKKVAGCLVEVARQGETMTHWVLSFGVNVSVDLFPPEIADTAGSLHAYATPPGREDLLLGILEAMMKILDGA